MTTPVRVAAWPVPSAVGQMQLGSLVMGAGTPYAIQQREGFDLPPIATADSERSGTDGSFGGLDQTVKRILMFHMAIHPDTVGYTTNKAVLARALKAAFQESQVEVGLTYRDADLGDLLVIGRPRRCSYLEDLMYPMRFQEDVLAQFDGLDPLLYSASLYDQIIPFGSAGTNAGLPFNASSLAGMTFQILRFIQNGGFDETATSPWVTTVATDLAAGATLTRDTGTVHAGPAAGKLVTSGASTNQGVRQASLTNLLPNTTYVFTCWVNLTTAGGSIRLLARDVTNAVLASSVGAVTTTGSWQQLTVSLTTGAVGPVQAALSVRDEGTAVTRTFYVDDVRGDLATSQQAYSDDSTMVGALFGAIGGGAGAAGFATCVNSGNENFAPVSQIKALGGPVTGPLHLERVESAEVITLNYNMATNDVLELDHDLHTVTLNGVANRGDIVDNSSAWWVMQPGSQTIHYRTDGPGAGSVAEIKWRDAWW